MQLHRVDKIFKILYKKGKRDCEGVINNTDWLGCIPASFSLSFYLLLHELILIGLLQDFCLFLSVFIPPRKRHYMLLTVSQSYYCIQYKETILIILKMSLHKIHRSSVVNSPQQTPSGFKSSQGKIHMNNFFKSPRFNV